MKFLNVIWIFLVLSGPAFAFTPMDFNKGFPVQLEPGAAIHRIELSEAVYAAGFRRDLGDIRIFNADGQTVPLHLQRVSGTPAAVSDERKILLPVFPLYAQSPDGKPADDYRMMIHTSETGTILSVEPRKKDETETAPFLLVDATGMDAPLQGLHIALKSPLPRLVSVSVEGSNDLFSWQTAGSGAVARIDHENGAIVKDRIPLYGQTWKYYRIKADADLSRMGDISGIPGKKTVSSGPSYQWLNLDGKQVEDGVFEYDLPVALPVSCLDLAGEENTIVGITVMAPYGESNWQPVREGSLFNLKMADTQIRSDPLPFSGPMNRFRIAVKGSPARLKVGWIPHEIIFMPQGPEPFLLTVGNITATPENLLTPLLSSIDQTRISRASLGSAKLLAGDKAALLPAPPPDYKKIILWGILGLGVLLLAIMAWSLVKKK